MSTATAYLTNVESWLKQIHEFSSAEASVFLVGNKCDLRERRQVTPEMGQKLADTYGLQFYEVSAKDGTNIDFLFSAIGRNSY